MVKSIVSAFELILLRRTWPTVDRRQGARPASSGDRWALLLVSGVARGRADLKVRTTRMSKATGRPEGLHPLFARVRSRPEFAAVVDAGRACQERFAEGITK